MPTWAIDWNWILQKMFLKRKIAIFINGVKNVKLCILWSLEMLGSNLTSQVSPFPEMGQISQRVLLLKLFEWTVSTSLHVLGTDV